LRNSVNRRKLPVLLLCLTLIVSLFAPLSLAEESASVPVTIEQTALGSVFFDKEPAKFVVRTEAPTISWEVRDYWGTPVRTGLQEVDGGTAQLVVPMKDNGYYELAVRSVVAGVVAGSATNSFAVIESHGFGHNRDIRFALNTHMGQFVERPMWDPETKQYVTRGVPNYEPDYIPLVDAAGVGQVRDELSWNNVEPEHGVYAFPPTHRDYMAELKERGIASLTIMNYGNKLYDQDAQGVGAAPYTDEGRQAYAYYGKALLDAYGDQIRDLEVWNEYNGNAPWNRGPCRLDADCYYEMLKVAYETIKAAHPDASVTGPAGVTIPYGWIERVFQRGGLQYLDAVTVHPYGFPQSPENGYRGRNLPGIGLEARIVQLQELIKKYNNGETKPIYFTEIGWGTQQSARGVTEQEQAQYQVRTHTAAFAAGVEKVFWYEIMNKKVLPLGPGANYGMIRHPDDPLGKYAPKPSFVSYATMTRQLAHKPFVAKDAAPEGARSYVFGEGQDAVRVMWAPDGQQNVTIAASGPIEITDIMGASDTYFPVDGHVYVTLSGDPMYVKGPVDGIAEGAPLTLSGPVGNIESDETIKLTIGFNPNGGQRNIPTKWDISGAGEPVTMTAKGGMAVEQTVVLPANQRPGLRTIEADVRIQGNLAGKLLTSVSIIEPLRLKDGKAAARLKAEPELFGMTARAGDGPETNLKIVTKAGKEAWSTNKAQQILYFYFNVDDRYIYDAAGETVRVTVEYFDEGTGNFSLTYDAVSNRAQFAPAIALTDSKTWKTHTFELTDALFTNRLNNSDLRFGIYAPAYGVSNDVAISEVTVEKVVAE
jgi:hypothetical protein